MSGRTSIARSAGSRARASGGLSKSERAALAAAEAYPHDASAAQSLQTIQTHLSHVFLTAERVYKFRKAVDLGFVRFATREERSADCLREVALNRRLAPDVYLGVAPLLASPHGARVGPVGERLSREAPGAEHCVVMRRLPDGRDALSMLRSGALGPEQIDSLARILSAFHVRSRLGVPASFSSADWRARCTGPVRANLDLLAASPPAVAPREVLARLSEATRAFEMECAERFERRRMAGRAVDGHGDLHLQHVWFAGEGGAPLVIDCLEFNESLRRIDAASDVAFLFMDLMYRGASALAARFLRVYAAESDDYDLYAVVDYYASYRAAVRAKVAAIVAGDAQIDAEQRARAAESALRHLRLADASLAPRGRGRLFLVGGVVGSGKTTVAAALADALEGVVVSSDRVRKHMLGIEATQRAASTAYTPDQKGRVYDAMLDRAAPVVASGRSAVLDATYASRRDREAARDWARASGTGALFVETRCAPEVAIARLERRAREGADASDAGPALYRASAAAFDPVVEWTPDAHCTLATDAGDWRTKLQGIANAWRSFT
ncbi:MAG: AAA family ATPase [Myxococcales bacterium]|nr:AAA family ATPase [Myxococcales bacterium]MDH5565840.1 AAA family ATPase [Myxococcales bacterium]